MTAPTPPVALKAEALDAAIYGAICTGTHGACGSDGARKATDEIKRIIASATPDAAAMRVPDGWKLAPVMSDEVMQEAATEIAIDTLRGYNVVLNRDEAQAVWAAMIAKVPEPLVNTIGAHEGARQTASVGVFATDNAAYLRLTGVGKDDARLFDVRLSTGGAEALMHEIGGLLAAPLAAVMKAEFLSPTVRDPGQHMDRDTVEHPRGGGMSQNKFERQAAADRVPPAALDEHRAREVPYDHTTVGRIRAGEQMHFTESGGQWAALLGGSIQYQAWTPDENRVKGFSEGYNLALGHARAAFATSPRASGDRYLVWSNERRAWWGVDHRGYTRFIDRAGRYDRDEALRIAGTRDGGWRLNKGNPDEIAIPEKDAIDQYADITREQAALRSVDAEVGRG